MSEPDPSICTETLNGNQCVGLVGHDGAHWYFDNIGPMYWISP